VRQSSLSSAQIVFSEAASGFDLSDLSLTRDGQAVSLAGATLTSTDNITWTLGNLDAATGRAGSYSLKLAAQNSGITGTGGQPLSGDSTQSWKMTAVLGTVGTDTIKLVHNAGAGDLYEVYVNNATATPDYTVNIEPLPDFTVVGNGGADTFRLVAQPGDPYVVTGNSLQLLGAASIGYSGITTLALGSGGYAVIADLAGLSLDVAGATSLSFLTTQHLGALSVGDGSTVTLTFGGDKVLVTTSLDIAGLLDLNDNDLIVNYASVSPVGDWNGGAYGGIQGWLAQGYNGGAWNGAHGIRTSAATPGLTGLSAAEAHEALNISGGATASWSGESVDANTVLVKFTYGGDANLDGKIDISDYGLIDSAVRIGGTGWFNGDFNLDGKIDITDYGIIDSNVRIQSVGL
jgi:hypothetical protein